MRHPNPRGPLRKPARNAARLALLQLALLRVGLVSAQTNVTGGTGVLGPGVQTGSSSSNSTVSGNGTVQLVVSNNCGDTIWPGVGTQAGTGPQVGGFVLDPGATQTMYVSSDWQGRVWGRTNCSFNADGSGPSQLNGVDGNGAACLTGDCLGVLNCIYTGKVPATLAEFNLQGGTDRAQTFYDISLVDGYNLPLGIVYLPARNTTWIPPNLTNAACIATAGLLGAASRTGTAYSNSSYPIPYETTQTDTTLESWCPWDLQEYPPTKPGDGVYPYPDDTIERPAFDPCLSACAATSKPSDCCTGSYDNRNVCQPGLYSTSAKAVCPDAYSFAFDDSSSTFSVPAGGGWEVVFCPAGRSTNIQATFTAELQTLAGSSRLTADVLNVVTNMTYIETHGNAAAPSRGEGSGVLVLLGVLWAAIWFVV